MAQQQARAYDSAGTHPGQEQPRPVLSDRRQHPRIPCSIPVSQGRQPIGTIQDLSLGGVSVTSTVGVGVGRVLSLDFQILDQPVCAPVEVLHLRAGGWGGRFVGLSDRDRVLLRSFSCGASVPTLPVSLPTRERVLETHRIHDVLNALIGDEAVGQIRGPGGEVAVRPVELVAGDGLTLLRCELDDGVALAPPFFLEITGYNSRYWFPILDGEAVGGSFWARISDGFIRSRRRRTARLTGELGLLGTFVNPVTGAWVQGRVIDLSRTGLRVRWREEGAAPELGTRLGGVAVRGAEHPVIVDALVRFSASNGNEHTVGLEVQAPIHGAWVQLVASLLHPSTRAASADPDDLWRLLVDAGYLGQAPGTPSGRDESLRTAFYEASAQLTDAPELGAQIVWPAVGRPEASTSILKIYNHTWLGHQTVLRSGQRVRGIPRWRILRDLLIHGYEHAVAEAPVGWFVTQAWRGDPIGGLAQRAFAQRPIARDQACVWPFRAWEIAVAEPIPQPHRGFEVSPATRGEIEALCLRIADCRPAAFVSALELTPAGMGLREVGEAWAVRGLQRERTVLVARRAGVPWAAAVLEASTDGLHLRGMLDVVRIFSMVGITDALEALLEVCQLWYADRGKGSFICLDESPGAPHSLVLEALGEELGSGDMTVLSSAVVPDLIEHVFEVSTERPA